MPRGSRMTVATSTGLSRIGNHRMISMGKQQENHMGKQNGILMKRIVSGMGALGLLASLSAGMAWARVEPQTPDEQPILPKKQKDEVTIVQDGDKLMEIHQTNGKVYGIKVIPKNGKPYYLVDMKGDGKFIQSQDERMLVPQWVILSW